MQRETWWWNEAVQRVVQEKKRAYKRWQRIQNEEDKKECKENAKQAKREGAKAKR